MESVLDSHQELILLILLTIMKLTEALSNLLRLRVEVNFPHINQQRSSLTFSSFGQSAGVTSITELLEAPVTIIRRKSRWRKSKWRRIRRKTKFRSGLKVTARFYGSSKALPCLTLTPPHRPLMAELSP